MKAKYKYECKKDPDFNFETKKESLVYLKLAELLSAKYVKKVSWIKRTTIKQMYTHKVITFYGDQGEKYIFEVDAHF